MEDSGLFNQMMQRMAQQTPPEASADVWSKMAAPKGPPVGGTLSGPPPLSTPAMPSMPAPAPSGALGAAPAAQRFATGEAVKQAVANNWNPNPVLLRAAMGR